MFNCIKTGFYARQGNLYLYGDAFAMPGDGWPDEPLPRPHAYLLLRVTSMSSEIPSRIHIDLETWAHWFEERAGKNVALPGEGIAVVWQPCSTLIASPGQWSWLGYEGVEP